MGIIFSEQELVTANRQRRYWKRRCEAAEKFIDVSPCDPDITTEQIEADKKWKKIVKCGEPRI